MVTPDLSVSPSQMRSTLESLSVSADSLSAGRNPMSALSDILNLTKTLPQVADKIAKVVGGGVLLGGLFGVVIGPGLVFEAVRDGRQAWNRGDWKEGISQTEKGSVGVSYGVVGAGMIVSQSAAFANLSAAGAVAATGTMIFTVGAVGMYSVVLISAIRKIGMNVLFRNELSEQESLDAKVAWLKNQVGNNEESAPVEEQNKWNLFVSKTSTECAEFVKKLPAVGLTEAQQTHVIKEVRRANNKQLLIQGVRVGVAVLGLTAVALGILLTGPLAPIIVAILFAVGALLWLVLDSTAVNKRVGDLVFGKGDFILPADIQKPVTLPPLQVQPEPSYWDLNHYGLGWLFPQ